MLHNVNNSTPNVIFPYEMAIEYRFPLIVPPIRCKYRNRRRRAMIFRARRCWPPAPVRRRRQESRIYLRLRLYLANAREYIIVMLPL